MTETTACQEAVFLESDRQPYSQSDFTCVEYEVNAEGTEPEVILRLDGDSITASNQVYDYRMRPLDPPFDQMSLWEMVSRTEKISKDIDDARASKRAVGEKSSGRKPLPRGSFIQLGSETHPQVESHKMRTRSDVIPVILSPTIPRPEHRDEWCRAMLIVFKPWRQPEDLKNTSQSWVDAFESWDFPDSLRQIMHNLNVQNECKDARDTYNALRKSGKVKTSLLPGILPEGEAMEMDLSSSNEELELALLEDDSLDAHSDCESESETDIRDPERTEESGRLPVDLASAAAILRSTPQINAVPASSSDTFTEASSEDAERIKDYTALMKTLKNDGKPKGAIDNPITLNDPTHSGTHEILPSGDAITTVQTLGDVTVEHRVVTGESVPFRDPLTIIEDIVDEFGLRDNTEQERVFRIVAEHFVVGNKEQLLMYMGGIGGTGKSHVIKAVVALFERCGLPQNLYVSAPTGIAAVLINGYTIHSLTLLPKSVPRPNVIKLDEIWRNVHWLILDEVSMVSAKTLSEISHQISIAKGCEQSAAVQPFGGVNILFSGDFGQLPPVMQKPLFSHALVKEISINTAQTYQGQTAMHGAYLWRLVDRHIQLEKNWRHALDPKYANLVNRVRLGKAWDGCSPHSNEQLGTGENYPISDFRVLTSRTLENLRRIPDEIEKFRNAPIICCLKSVRDQFNTIRVNQICDSSKTRPILFAAVDFIGKRKATPIEQKRLFRLSSSVTNDALGLLPLVSNMKVMLTENIALGHSVVNGAEGYLVGVQYRIDESGNKIAMCAFVKIPNSQVVIDPQLGLGVYPILPVRSTFRYKSPHGAIFTIKRVQLPILPAYAYTDYKSQGRTLDAAIVDLTGHRGAGSLQSIYVMLSRVRALSGLALLRPFYTNKLTQNLQAEFRAEFSRLRTLHTATAEWFASRPPIVVSNVVADACRARQLRLQYESVNETSTPLPQSQNNAKTA